jgi:hypothetical protein
MLHDARRDAWHGPPFLLGLADGLSDCGRLLTRAGFFQTAPILYKTDMAHNSENLSQLSSVIHLRNRYEG